MASMDVMNCQISIQQQNITMDVGLKPIEQQQRMSDCYFDMSINNICRVCLEKNQDTKKMCNIFQDSKPTHFPLMIMACASVQIIEGDGLPAMMCHKCLEKLNIAWHFKQQCENSEMKLRHYFGNSQHLQITPDLNGFNIGIKEEHNILTLGQDPLLIPPLPQQYTHPPVQNSPPVTDTVNQPVSSLDEDINRLFKSKKDGPQSRTKEPKQHQCDTCGKTFNRREYLTQHIRTHTGEKPYHCHLCEKRFVNSGHLSTHMRTHTGERPHGCAMCPKAFSTRQELQKHTMVHSGERPFICKLCDKRFGSSSNLYSHLRHHTGEKNFTCEHCGKPFYTKQELKQHMVVHTGEKAFLCEYCNKRFSQIAHLKRHSKLHTVM